jgi:DNA-directed RNA polymerase specialized sigma24 family protein
MDDSRTFKNIDAKLSALLALTSLSLVRNAKGVKIELLLRRAGLDIPEIAKILDKNESAIRKAIQRAK